MNLEVFAHPLSFRQQPQAQADRLASHGVDGVRLAFTYHSGRWLLTTSDPCAVVDFRSGQWFADEPARSDGSGPTRSDGGEPARADGGDPARAAGSDPARADGRELALPVVGDEATTATTALLRAGLRVTAWLVGLHQSGPATRHPDSALRNAFGHHYRHALCPARPEVRTYATDLVARAARRPGVTGLELEAFGYLGWQHQSAHDKLGTELRPVDRWLLSLCFCSACADRFTDAGINVDEMAETVREALLAQLAEPREAGELAADARTVLGSDLHDAVLAVRSQVTTDLVRDAVAAAGGLPVSVRTTANPYACDGKSAADLNDLAAVAGALTVTDLTGDADALRRDLAAAGRTGARVTAGWSLASDRTADERHLADVARDARAAGAHSLVLYAYDLAPAPRLAWLRNLGLEPASNATPATTSLEPEPAT